MKRLRLFLSVFAGGLLALWLYDSFVTYEHEISGRNKIIAQQARLIEEHWAMVERQRGMIEDQFLMINSLAREVEAGCGEI